MIENGNREMGTRKRRILRYVLIGACIVLFGIAVASSWFAIEMRPTSHSGDTVTIDVKQGYTVGQVASILQENGIIRSGFAFRVYSHFFDPTLRIKAGHYIFQKGTSLHHVIVVLDKGQLTNHSVVITIPEGFTVMQIAQRLEQNGICKQQSFIQEEEHGVFPESFLKNMSKKSHVKYRLEGYLFPDTYDFEKNESPHKVINELLHNFALHVTPDMIQNMSRSGMTLPVVITEASLVEREAKVNSDRPIVASVINNRLSKKPPMKLQIDATIEYILGHQDIVTDADLKTVSPYNTYLYTGLPPGPIANPGMASIDAVMNPAKTKYYYYVVKNNGTGEHYFAQTYAEQLKNEELSQQNLKSSTH